MVVIGFRLEDKLKDCPPAWQNFINEAQGFFWQDVAVKRINAMLKPYGGRYRHPGYGDPELPFVEFKTEAGLMLFTLKWA